MRYTVFFIFTLVATTQTFKGMCVDGCTATSALKKAKKAYRWRDKDSLNYSIVIKEDSSVFDIVFQLRDTPPYMLGGNHYYKVSKNDCKIIYRRNEQ